MIGHQAMTTPTQRRRLTHVLVAEILISAMVDLEPAFRAIIVAKSAPEARRFQLRQPRRMFAPAPTHGAWLTNRCELNLSGLRLGSYEPGE